MQTPSPRTFPLPVPVAVLLVCTLLSAGGSAGAASLAPPGADATIRAGLADLHQGLYGRAEEHFREAARLAPGDPAPSLFIAFAWWWRVIQDRSDRSRDEAFLAASAEAITTAEAGLETAPDDVRLLVSLGTARILRSQVEGLRRNLYKAATEARRGRKALLRALEIDPANREALFGLGAYNYFTERIPGLARAVLFMPKGDADIGLEQLKSVAESDAYFHTDARLLLALICGSRDEKCYADALAQIETALAADPRSPLLLGSKAGVKMRLGEYPQAIAAFEEAVGAAAGPESERREQRRALKLYLADALAADFRLSRAAAILDEVREGPPLPSRDRQLFDRLAVEIEQRRGAVSAAAASDTPAAAGGTDPAGPTLARTLRPAIAAQEKGDEARAAGLLAEAAVAFPAEPLPHFLLGRSHFQRRRWSEAEHEMALAAERLTDEPPAWMSGWIELYRGLAEKEMGRRLAARAHFQAATEIKRFRSAERGYLELQEGTPPHARCRPGHGAEGAAVTSGSP